MPRLSVRPIMKKKCTFRSVKTPMWIMGRELHCDPEWWIDATKNLSQILVQSQGLSSKNPSFRFYVPTETPRLSSLALQGTSTEPRCLFLPGLSPAPPSALPGQAQLQSPGWGWDGGSWKLTQPATPRSWMRSEQVTGQDVLLCSGVPPKCTLGIVWAKSLLP